MTRSSVPCLKEGAIHVWRVGLDAPTTIVTKLSTTLSKDERQRTEQLVLERHRHRFIIGRAGLRILLGAYLKQAPKELVFSYGPHGKPALQTDRSASSIRFNLAHSQSIALYAFALDRDVGVDVEHWQAVEDAAGIAQRFFAPDEIKELKALPTDRWEEGFYRCWTRKEAYIKARGKGLTIPLSTFSVIVRSGERAASVRSTADPEGVSQWSVEEIRPAARSSAAVAAEGSGWTVERFQLPQWPKRSAELARLLRQLE
jgi:4'-phosphopantetheinyl transferase